MNLDRSGQVPLTEQIYRGFRDAVRTGLLPSGTRLPSTRRLAAILKVARNTVSTAYELLQAEGITTVRAGAAPRITEGLRLEGAADACSGPVPGPALSARGEIMAANLRGRGWAFRHGALQPGAPALDCFPYEEWARCLRRAARLERTADLQYRNYAGVPVLKQRLASHLAAERGVRARPDQILVTGSMQASLFLISQVLTDPGDDVWLEEPGYLGARTAFHGAGLRIHPLPTDGEGADATRMSTRDGSPRLIYVTPSHHYPLGMRMPLARRMALLDTARSAGAIVLEDDYDSEFLFSGRPVAALHGLAEEGRVIYLGTFSKSLMPGLRIAYCVVPVTLVEPFTQLMRNVGCAANVQAQVALAQFMDCGAYQKHLKQIRHIYRERGEMLVEALRRRLGNRIRVELPTGNVQVALSFRERIDDVGLALAMQNFGFAVSPLSNCYSGEDRTSGLIIGFAGATAEQISQGVDILGDLLGQYAF
ncbi:PLP-dependent aminotransferase family protein [Roseibium salinum]|uniref:PLP-dependent aminotransferase family protein n=1 Tax=Roseibium salinum TaxID=1604349 RepID=A0ABT3QYG3_9HYPH|nr:PLP-dependent aminotransferase family protein [Roseibium sp. DSM 29163]MCX2721871.1 PLP-dependent aminotransferase family protein [Roseibium sp. DSM 29163]